MSEAYGTILLKLPGHLIDLLCEDDEGVSRSALETLFSEAGIVHNLKSYSTLIPETEHGIFYHEGVEVRNGVLAIIISGDDWMPVMQILVKNGKEIEAYGSINHEHGITEFYALNADGESYYELIDFEASFNTEREEEIVADWLGLIPDEIKVIYPEVFDEDQEEDY
jgi:hypothetical protein